MRTPQSPGSTSGSRAAPQTYSHSWQPASCQKTGGCVRTEGGCGGGVRQARTPRCLRKEGRRKDWESPQTGCVPDGGDKRRSERCFSNDKETADSPWPKCSGGPCQSGHDSFTWTVLSRRGEGAEEGEEWGWGRAPMWPPRHQQGPSDKR